MIQIEEEKIAEMMFDIWHNSESLKNPVMVGEYIANKLKEAITVTRCCEGLPKTNCTLNRQTCGKGSGCKYPHCHL